MHKTPCWWCQYVTLSNSPPTCSPLLPSITHSLFHSRASPFPQIFSSQIRHIVCYHPRILDSVTAFSDYTGPDSLCSTVFRLDALALSVIATATWLAGWLGGWLGGWLAVTLRYCIKTAKPIGKLFRPSESPITLVFWDPCADTKFQGEPLQRGR